MNKREFLEGIGLAPPESKVTEIVVPEDKVEKITDESSSATESSNADKDIREQLGNIHATLSKLEGTVQASPAIIQGEQVLDTLEKLQHRFDELEAELEPSKCPKCEKIIGWDCQVSELPDYEFQRKSGKGFFMNLRLVYKIVRFKECPYCHHIEEVKEE